MDDRDDPLNDLLAARPLSVELELRLERRARLYADRLNQRLGAQGDADLYDIDDDRELAQILMLLCETALDNDDDASDPITGHLRPRDAPLTGPNDATGLRSR